MQKKKACNSVWDADRILALKSYAQESFLNTYWMLVEGNERHLSLNWSQITIRNIYRQL